MLAQVRAGVLEHGLARLMREAQCGRADGPREGEIHDGFDIAHDGAMDHVDLKEAFGPFGSSSTARRK